MLVWLAGVSYIFMNDDMLAICVWLARRCSRRLGLLATARSRRCVSSVAVATERENQHGGTRLTDATERRATWLQRLPYGPDRPTHALRDAFLAASQGEAVAARNIASFLAQPLNGGLSI